MAYIEERNSGWLVVWRDAATGKKTARLVTWGGSPGTVGGVITKEAARETAEALAARKRVTERANRKPLKRVIKANAQDYPDWNPSLDFIAEDEDRLRFENYLEALIDGGAITESAKHTYRHTLTNRIRGTKLGRKNIRFIEPADVEVCSRSRLQTGRRHSCATGRPPSPRSDPLQVMS